MSLWPTDKSRGYGLHVISDILTVILFISQWANLVPETPCDYFLKFRKHN
jgi:hypothetical protein